MERRAEPISNAPFVCPACGSEGAGRYCTQCGQRYPLERISLRTLIGDVVELFTNFEQGFGYTLKRLVTMPGQMQWDYLHRDRIRYQKPFSFLFICASVAALVRYVIYRYLEDAASWSGASEARFFREYWMFVHLALMPLYVLITYLFFARSRYNYAEVGVAMIYLFSTLFLVSGLISFFRLLIPHLDTVWLELPFFMLLTVVTFLRFFKEENRVWTGIKSLLVLLIIFLVVQSGEDLAFRWLSD